MNARETAAEIEEMAARWVVRIDREGLSEALAADLEAWRSADPRREGAFLQAEAAWRLLEAPQATSAPRRVPPSRRLLIGGGVGALAAAAAGVAVFVTSPTRISTVKGEIRRVPLADGSVAAVNTDSRVEIDFAKALRRVRLARGEAWFQVAKNAQRPFVVEAGSIRVRAVGTAFSVRRRAGGAEVCVTEGVVEAWTDGQAGPPVRIAAGGQAYVGDDAAIITPVAAPSAVDRALAWRTGRIDLAGETLAAAAADFNRYNTQQIVVDDPDLAREQLYGVFRTDDPEGFVRAVEASLGARVVRRSDREIVLAATGT